jgi:transaldolase/glucose-6-phosphate isomerase
MSHFPVNSMTWSLAPAAEAALEKAQQQWVAEQRVRRIWQHDASVWTSSDEAKWLGWLAITTQQLEKLELYQRLTEEVRSAGFTHAVLLGMGGSSLCPEVLRLSFGKNHASPDLHVLDSTDPARVLAIESQIDLERTLFIVASKSGSTLEPNVFKQYFFERTGRNGSQFIAITDPGSQMEKVAQRDGFRKIFHGVPEIGGRFSALSDFGIVPAAVMGIDVSRFLHAADVMAQACKLDSNPALQLGLILGTQAVAGRNKLTVIASPGIFDLGAWLEQLVAESTGKDGKAIIPVDREPLGAIETYGQDRVFAYLRLESAPDEEQDRMVDDFARAGHPVVLIYVRDVHDLGQEFFRWEFATAVAGAILGINPFNQPDVEASKIETKKLTSEFEATGSLPSETPSFVDDGIKVFNAAGGSTLQQALQSLLGSLKAGDYFAQLAYIEMNAVTEEILTAIRTQVRDHKHVATCVGFGPRFLHSTGQAYKGGPDTGVFLQITADDAQDLAVPGQTYSFSVVKAAQARGDLNVLLDRGRRALRIHLGKDVEAGLRKVAAAIDAALGAALK